MRHLQFSVETVAKSPTGLYIGGGVYGDLIRLGDRFTSACLPDCAPRTVVLEIRAILCYGKYLNQVHSGISAELELAVLSEVQPSVGETLVGDVDSPAFEEIEILGDGELHVEPV
jgi:hypothetical protein